MEKTVPIFIASSIVSLQRERQELSVFLERLNSIYQDSGVRFQWNRPETMSHRIVLEGSQHPLNEKIRKSHFFILIVGQSLGEYTEKEFDFALEQLRKTGLPLMVPYFYMQPDTFPSDEVVAFRNYLKRELGYYADAYSDFETIKQKIHTELIDGGALRKQKGIFGNFLKIIGNK